MEVIDNIYSFQTNSEIYKEVFNLPYHIGELDDIGFEPTGVVAELTDKDDKLVNYLSGVINEHLPHLRNVQRTYVNLFQAGEQPNWHVDGACTTVLIYVMPQELNLSEGGETQFWMDDKIIGIKPKPCRMVVFDGRIDHKATSFKSFPRFTIAFKYGE